MMRAVPTTGRRGGPLALTAALGLALGCAGLEGFDLGAILPGAGPLTEQTVADGLREALTIGTERAADQLSAAGGFGSDPNIRLSLPQPLDDAASTLRRFGLAGQLDTLEATMNRAAERAAGEAAPVFARAIRSMTLEDAFAILNGPDDAATVYFREHTSAALRERFTPVVDASMESVGLYAQYRDLMARYEALPVAKPAVPDLAGYVTDRTLEGLFTVLASEERAIREDPAARTTALLRRVFGASGRGLSREPASASRRALRGLGLPAAHAQLAPRRAIRARARAGTRRFAAGVPMLRRGAHTGEPPHRSGRQEEL